MWHLKDLSRLGKPVHGIPCRDICFKGFEIDSRKIGFAQVFVPIKGARVDGADFVKDALERGAVGFVWDRDYPPDRKTGSARYSFYLKVRDSVEFLRKAAILRRKDFTGRVVGITGSAGKTTTKEFVGEFFNFLLGGVEYTPGGLNSQIGLPLAVANFSRGSDLWITEMGISMPGEMDTLVSITKPHVAVITSIGESHLEFLGSMEGVLSEKWKVSRFADVLILGFDFRYHRIAERIAEKTGSFLGKFLNVKNLEKVASCGGSGEAYVGGFRKAVYFPVVEKNFSLKDNTFGILRLSPSTTSKVASFHSKIEVENSRIFTEVVPVDVEGHMRGFSAGDFKSLRLPVFGEAVFVVITTALALGSTLELPFHVLWNALAEFAESFTVPQGRFRILKLGRFVLIDDCYNSNPLSLRNSLTTAQAIARSLSLPLILVIGDMLELGEDSVHLHSRFSDFIKRFDNVRSLYTVGENSRFIEHPDKRGHFSKDDIDSLLRTFLEAERDPAVVLVKASRGIALERFIKGLEAEL